MLKSILTGIDDRQLRVGFIIEQQGTATLNFLRRGRGFRQKRGEIAADSAGITESQSHTDGRSEGRRPLRLCVYRLVARRKLTHFADFSGFFNKADVRR